MRTSIFILCKLTIVGMLCTGIACSGGTESTRSDSSQPNRGTSPPVSESGAALDITSSTSEGLAGLYRRGEVGIQFAASKVGDVTNLRLQALDGRELLRVEDNETEVRLVVMGVYTESRTKSDLRAAANPSGNSSAALSAKSETGDRRAMGVLDQSPEYALLPWLSQALGESGYTGNDYPATFPLHMMGASVASAKGIKVQVIQDAEAASVSKSAGGEYSEYGVRQDPLWGACSTTGQICVLNNCPGANNCAGMCGPKCECWRWVCGSCCAFAGCLYHDRNCGSTFEECAANFWQFFVGGCLPAWPK